MKNFEEGSKKRKNDFKDKYKKDKGHSNKNFSDKDFQINNNSNKNDIFYEKTIPIHCFDCYFTPRLKIIFPEIIDSNSAIKIKYECPNEHKKHLNFKNSLNLLKNIPYQILNALNVILIIILRKYLIRRYQKVLYVKNVLKNIIRNIF